MTRKGFSKSGLSLCPLQQGCQKVCFYTKDFNFGILLKDLYWKIFGIFYDHLVHLMAFWYTCSQFDTFFFGLLCQGKTINPALQSLKL
jgi:hypothetical protein